MLRPDVRALAVRFCAALAEDIGGRPMQWRSISPVARKAGVHEPDLLGGVLAFAIEQGWIEVEGGHGVMLTEAGRQLAK